MAFAFEKLKAYQKAVDFADHVASDARLPGLGRQDAPCHHLLGHPAPYPEEGRRLPHATARELPQGGTQSVRAFDSP